MKRRHQLLLLPLAGALAVGVWLADKVRVPEGFSRQWIEVNGVARSYLLYVPRGLEATTAVPLVLSLHGYASWPASFAQVTGWGALADKHGFVVAYPAATGLPKRWHTDIAAAGEVDDLAFLSAVIEDVADKQALDRRRIYLSGLSNGAGMVNAMARLRPAGIAAMGTVAGAYVAPQGEPETSRPLPVIAFHGTADPLVPFGGGAVNERQGWVFPAVETWAAEWAQRNGCTAPPVTSAVSEHVSETRYGSCAADNEVVLYTITGGGHSWPGGRDPLRLTIDPLLDAINASAVMWEFFERHPLGEG